ncbi:MAG: hypothetical protein CVV27_02180 [Candidatus Melainabacteria bacterium HGW-Melainabacteria-1]|nr:MAG: hypothetical protein CVV27_02180 [Candidatus Melainabacteria bacterium HGW-Melainabacteria-1]
MSEPLKKTLARQRFLALLGKSALGLWLLQLIPSGLTALKPPAPPKSPPSRMASRVKIHPQAVKRGNTRT